MKFMVFQHSLINVKRFPRWNRQATQVGQRDRNHSILRAILSLHDGQWSQEKIL